MKEKNLINARNGMRVIFEEEFKEINEKHEKELAEKDKKYAQLTEKLTEELAEKDEALNAKDKIIVQLIDKLQKFENTQTTSNTI